MKAIGINNPAFDARMRLREGLFVYLSEVTMAKLLSGMGVKVERIERGEATLEDVFWLPAR